MKYLLAIVLMLISNISMAKPPIFIDSYEEAKTISQTFDQPMIVIFSAEWCQYCLKLKQDITKNIDHFENTTICILDISSNDKLAKDFKVKKIPKIILFDKKGNVIKEIVGYTDIKNLK